MIIFNLLGWGEKTPNLVEIAEKFFETTIFFLPDYFSLSLSLIPYFWSFPGCQWGRLPAGWQRPHYWGLPRSRLIVCTPGDLSSYLSFITSDRSPLRYGVLMYAIHISGNFLR